MNFRKLILFISIIILIPITLLITYRIFLVNTRYPQRQDLNVKQGDYYDIIPGVEMCVTDSKWLNSDDLLRDYDDVWYVDNPNDYKAVEVKIILKNYSKTRKKISLFNIYIESDKYDWNGCDADLFSKKNEISMEEYLEPGQEIECIMPYTFLKQNYKEDDWIQLHRYGYYLVEKRYPLKVKWRFNENKQKLVLF